MFSRFKTISVLTALLAFCVVVLGAYVRLSDAGLGCPDWPGCYGSLTVPQSEEAIAKAHMHFPQSQVVVHKAWKEMAHRYLAGSLGLLILWLAIMAGRVKASMNTSATLSYALVLIVGMQAALGMWTVTLLLKPAIVTAHLMGGMTTLALLVWIAVRNSALVSSHNFMASMTLSRALRIGLLIVCMQIILGGWTSTNYAALACTDFPTCHQQMVPSLDVTNAFHIVRNLGEDAMGKPLSLEALSTIQWFHRVGALVTFLFVAGLAIALLRLQGARWLGLMLLLTIVMQVLIGIGNLMMRLPIPLAVSHNAGAALLLVEMVLLNALVTQRDSTYTRRS